MRAPTKSIQPHGSTIPPSSACERLSGDIYALGFSAWKRPLVKRFLQRARVHFITRLEEIPDEATLVVWGSRDIAGLPHKGINIVRLEDGFLRSVGLGADLTTPLSWVADTSGIYYDATRPSDLELLLTHHTFEPELLQRAVRLRHHIVEAGITKYNVGGKKWRPPSRSQTIILVPGQVEDDASIRFGAPGIHRNIDLLQAVRANNPDAYILYKPHPDVQAGLRVQGSGEQHASEFCDEVIVDTPMEILLTEVDEVHLMTSLTGFEALLRGLPVTCYGQPFYSGWGMTHDISPSVRRQRKRSLDELVAATLIIYPTYVHPESGQYLSAEEALRYLQSWRNNQPTRPPGIWLKIKRNILSYAARRRKQEPGHTFTE